MFSCLLKLFDCRASGGSCFAGKSFFLWWRKSVAGLVLVVRVSRWHANCKSVFSCVLQIHFLCIVPSGGTHTVYGLSHMTGQLVKLIFSLWNLAKLGRSRSQERRYPTTVVLTRYVHQGGFWGWSPCHFPFLYQRCPLNINNPLWC